MGQVINCVKCINSFNLDLGIFLLFQCLMLAASWVFYYGVLCACAPTLWWLLILRFLTGIGLGSLPVIAAFGMEFLPTNLRARGLQGMEIVYSMGGVLGTLLAYLLIQPYGWRIWVLVCTFPSLIFIILSTCIPESARFYVVTGEYKNARKVMQTIARFNKCELPPQQLYAKQQETRGQIKDLFKPELRRLTLLLWANWFISLFVYYGSILLITETIKFESTCGNNQSSRDMGDSACALECKGPDSKQLADIFHNSLAELPATIAVAFLADWCGRKYTFIFLFLMFTLIAVLLSFCTSGMVMLVMLFLWRGFGIALLSMTYLYTPEAYPTHVRSTASGMLCSIGRIGGLLTPFVAQVLSKYSMSLTFNIYAGMSLIGALCAFFLPIETKGRMLA